jgi:hypothetical protein
MTFLAPAILFGMALAAAPVIIHLLNRRHYRRIPWAAMEFLAEVEAVAARRLRLEQLLLLLLRTLIVLLLVLAAARPFLSAAGGAGRPEAVILVDKSASMQYRAAAGSLFDFAKARVREILSGLGGGAAVTIATFDTAVQFPAGTAPVTDAGALSAELDSLEAGHAGTDYPAALVAAADAARAFPSGAPAVFIVSDFAAGGRFPSAAPPGRKGHVYLVPVAEDDGEDVGIASLAPAGAAFTAGAGQLAVTLRNTTNRRASLPLSVSVDGAPSGAVAVVVEALSTVTANIAADALASSGTHRVEASIPPDAYPLDDRAWAVVSREPLNLAVSASGDAQQFLLAALSSAPAGSFAFSTIDAASLPSALSSGGAILASEPPPPALREDVWARVRDGRFLVVFLDPRYAADVAAFLSASGDTALASAAANLVPMSGDFHPAAGAAHPVTAFLSATADLSIASVAQTQVLDFPVPKGDTIETPLTVDTPAGPKVFLAFARVGKGRVAIFNASADRTSGDFPVTPFFVPLLFETLAYVAPAASPPTAFLCGETALVPVPAGRARIDIETPAGKSSSAVIATDTGAAASFVPELPGFYRLADATIAVNVPPAESDLRLAPRARILDAFGGTFVEGAGLTAKVSRSARGSEISAPFFLAALALLVVEMAAVRFLKRF